MSKLKCTCGFVIRDTHYDLPWKGDVRRDQALEPYFEKITSELAPLIEAVAAGQRDKWIDKHFLAGYPRNESTESLISDYLSGPDEQLTSQIFGCENCGRLWLQKAPGVNAYFSYSPDSGEMNRVLASAQPTQVKTPNA